MPITEMWWVSCDPNVLLAHLKAMGIELSQNQSIFLKWDAEENIENILAHRNVTLEDGEPTLSEITGGGHAVKEFGGKQVVRPSGQVAAQVECDYVIETEEAGTGGRNIGIIFRKNKSGGTDVVVLGDDILISKYREQIKDALFKAGIDTLTSQARVITQTTIAAGEGRIKIDQTGDEFVMHIQSVEKKTTIGVDPTATVPKGTKIDV